MDRKRTMQRIANIKDCINMNVGTSFARLELYEKGNYPFITDEVIKQFEEKADSIREQLLDLDIIISNLSYAHFKRGE